MRALGLGRWRRQGACSFRTSSHTAMSAGLVCAASVCVAALGVFPFAAQAATNSATNSSLARPNSGRPSLSAHSAASSYCSKMTAAKISAIVKTTFKFVESRVINSTVECIYFGTVSTSAKGGEVIISMNPRMPYAPLTSRAAAEARISAEVPKNVKLVFTPLPRIGKTAFSWAYQMPINGGQALGIADNKGTTGYGALVGGPAKYFGAPSSHLSTVEQLLALGLTA
jgi:hypothetical protein